MNQTPETKTDMIGVTDLDTFVSLLAGWHGKKVETLRHMVDIPPGTEMTINDADGNRTIVLVGDYLAGFKAGLELALIEMGELPFLAEMEADAIPA